MADAIQVGARNRQDHTLLWELGPGETPVLLTRGMSATVEELPLPADSILCAGSPRVILCERGIWRFETSYRFGAVAILRERTTPPVIVDPTDTAVRRGLVLSRAEAALACRSESAVAGSPSFAPVGRRPAMPLRSALAVTPISGTFSAQPVLRQQGDRVSEVAELVRAAAEGDQASWDRLVDRYNGLVWSVARAHRLSGHDAADVVQTTWLRAVEHLGRLRDPDRIGAWLATTVRYESLRAIRLGLRQAPTEIDLDAWISDDPPVDASLLELERDRALWSALGQLDERCQVLLRMLVAEPPATYDEIGAALDMRIGSIGPTRGRCLERLRALAAAAGLSRDRGGSDA